MAAGKCRTTPIAPSGAAVKLPGVRRLARIASIALITAGLVVLIDVGLTVAYREPVSSI